MWECPSIVGNVIENLGYKNVCNKDYIKYNIWNCYILHSVVNAWV